MNRLYWHDQQVGYVCFVPFVWEQRGVIAAVADQTAMISHLLPMCWATRGRSWGHVMMWARFGSQGSIALNWHSRYSGTRYSGTWLYKEYLPARVMNSFFIEPICNDDVGLEIRHLNPKKAPGPDCIGGKLIQLCPDIFSDNLTKIYNRAIQTGVYPHDMKLAQVIALYKKGARHDPNNYRPISLLSIFDKIFEKILCKRLISFLERNRILYCHQYGFRKFYSTLLALIEVTDLIKRFLDEKQYVIGIFIDFRKAFDTVNHDILLDKLECYGIRGHANKFFRSYLTNRRQYTLVNGIKSNSGYVNCGVPQGSVLGPLLFLLYINDIKHAIGCDNVKLFADDTFLFTNDRNIDAVKEKASNLFEKIFRWCVANQLSINSEKTNFVLFHAKNKPIPENFDCIHTTFITLNRVKCVQYLGLMIDENLYWHMHVEHVYNSLVKYFGLFNHVKTIISKKIARQLYFAFIHSRIKYGIEVFGDCANEYLQKLQVIQNKLLKLLLNFDRRTSTNELHQQLSLLKVVDIHNVNLLSFVNECRSGRCPTLFSNYYHVREAGYDLREKDRLHVPMARTDIGQSSCKIKGARLWNNKFNLVNQHLHKKGFRAIITKQFIETYQ